MGTRADFYVGRGAGAEWIGSIAWDGGAGQKRTLKAFKCATEDEFRQAVANLASDDDFTEPSDGWPWPWKNSRTTDFAYAFDTDRVYTSCFGSSWLDLAEHKAYSHACDACWQADDPEGDEPEWPQQPAAEFPDMSSRQAVTFGKRSGVILVGR